MVLKGLTQFFCLFFISLFIKVAYSGRKASLLSMLVFGTCTCFRAENISIYNTYSNVWLCEAQLCHHSTQTHPLMQILWFAESSPVEDCQSWCAKMFQNIPELS